MYVTNLYVSFDCMIYVVFASKNKLYKIKVDKIKNKPPNSPALATLDRLVNIHSSRSLAGRQCLLHIVKRDGQLRWFIMKTASNYRYIGGGQNTQPPLKYLRWLRITHVSFYRDGKYARPSQVYGRGGSYL